MERLDRAASLKPALPRPGQDCRAHRAPGAGVPARPPPSSRRAFERDAGDSDLHLLLGLAESGAGRPAEAVRLLSEALRLAPRDHVAEAVLRELRRSGRIDPLRLDPYTRADYRDRIAQN